MIHRSNDETLKGIDTLGGALQRGIKVMMAEGTGKEIPLKAHPGKGLSILQLGMDGLLKRARTMEMSEANYNIAVDRTYAEYHKGEDLCESPIERSMLAALLTAQWTGFDTIPPRVHSALDKEEMMPAGDVLIVPQMAFMRYRLDFGVVLRLDGMPPQIVAVECDGADFHNDQRREVLRVNYLKSWGIPVFKFTGREIHSDPFEAARKVTFGICQWRDAL